MATPRYVLITSAKDEGSYIGKLLDSVARQSLRPVKHLVVDNGSSDNTADTVRVYESQEPFVQLLERENDGQRSVGSKVAALRTAYEALMELEFEYVGCLDADVTLPPDYYERIIKKMSGNPDLGIASGVLLERNGSQWKGVQSNTGHVHGAVQFFRRTCFEAIGGYDGVEVFGEHSLAEIKARMKGWRTRCFDDLVACRNKPLASPTDGSLTTCCRLGMTDYLLGKDPLYVMLKGVRRLAERPYVTGAMARLYGYWRLALKREPLAVSDDVKAFVRAEGKSY